MPMLKLFNTLTAKIEEFKPLKAGEAKMYNCGPTVYNYAHIGNLRAYIFVDVLRRTLEFNSFKVDQIMNITDIGHLTSDADEGEDKMVKALRREKRPLTLDAMHDVASFYADAFITDLKALNIKMPREMPKASEHIKDDIDLITDLEKKGFVYQTADGLYFETSKFPQYGKLGGVNKAELRPGARVSINSAKRHPSDFNLWKFSKDKTLGFDSPWGKGFPGWHIECSAMSRKYLGQPFDIHTGGVDHIGTHHNNEIAQSEAAYDVPLANFWLHNEYMNVKEGKMAKSGDNFITLRSVIEKGYSPMAYRYYVLGANYRTPMEFSFKAVENAGRALEKLISLLSALPRSGGKISNKYLELFTDVINSNLDTAKAVSLIWELLQDKEVNAADKYATVMKFDEVLGLQLATTVEESQRTVEIPKEVSALLDDRKKARAESDWSKADRLREEIKKLGFEVKDTETGQKVKRL